MAAPATFRIELAPELPRDAAAWVLEEDTFLVLSAPADIPETREHPIRIFTAIWEQEPEILGALIERPTRRGPHRWLAVVHELQRDPSADATAITKALERALSRANEDHLDTLGVELLGAKQAKSTGAALDLALDAIREALRRHRDPWPRRIVLEVAEAQREQVESRTSTWRTIP